MISMKTDVEFRISQEQIFHCLRYLQVHNIENFKVEFSRILRRLNQLFTGTRVNRYLQRSVAEITLALIFINPFLSKVSSVFIIVFIQYSLILSLSKLRVLINIDTEAKINIDLLLLLIWMQMDMTVEFLSIIDDIDLY